LKSAASPLEFSVFVTVEGSSKGTDTGYMTLQFRGLDIANVESGFFGLGRSDPYFEIAKKNADYTSGIVRYNVVYRSERRDNNLNPYWLPVTLPLEELCYNDVNYPLQIRVFDFQYNSDPTFIGCFDTKIHDLIDHISIKGTQLIEECSGAT
jgi:hypothetical protein